MHGEPHKRLRDLVQRSLRPATKIPMTCPGTMPVCGGWGRLISTGNFVPGSACICQRTQRRAVRRGQGGGLENAYVRLVGTTVMNRV